MNQKGFYQSSSASIGRISSDTKDEAKEKLEEEQNRINAVINESSWATQTSSDKPSETVKSALSFDDLMAQEDEKKKQRRNKNQQNQPKPNLPPPDSIERRSYPNQPVRAQEAYADNEGASGEMVYDPATGQQKFVPYQQEPDYYQDDYDQGGYGGGHYGGGYGQRNGGRRGGGRYGGGKFDRRNQYGGYKSGGYNANQFYDSGENDDSDQPSGFPGFKSNYNDRKGGNRGGFRKDYYEPSNSYGNGGYNDRRGGRKGGHGGGHGRDYQKPQKLSATQKYGDYSKHKEEEPPKYEEQYQPQTHKKYVPKVQLGGAAQPAPPPPMPAQKDNENSTNHEIDPKEIENPQPSRPERTVLKQPPPPPPVKQETEKEKPVIPQFNPKKLTNEEEWNPDA